MQAIITKYIPATNTRCSRIKAKCERGSHTIDYPHDLSGDDCHIAAADALVAKFVAEDAARYGTERNPWSKPRVCGGLPGGGCAHVFTTDHTPELVNALELAVATLNRLSTQRGPFNNAQGTLDVINAALVKVKGGAL